MKRCPKCDGVIAAHGRLGSEERRVADRWKGVTGFEFMHLDEVRSGDMTFARAYSENIRWLEGVLAEATHLGYSEIECDCSPECEERCPTCDNTNLTEEDELPNGDILLHCADCGQMVARHATEER